MSVDLRDLDLREGELLAGKFRVERLIGAGGMGVVIEATHVTLKDRVALKFLRAAKFADQTTITRFLREAQAAARIKSPHVARVLDVGTLENGSPYMVMEYLDGIDLGTLLEKEKTLSVESTIAYALQTCEALAAAHASGVVHRDVKPSNLFLTQGPDGAPLVKVLDFGISKLLDGTTSGSITETQRAVGSPSYMAPEQMRSAKRVDGRADIWSMGVVLFELLTGEAPFVAETIPELYALILDKASRPTSLRGTRADVPEELERIIERCLQKDADARYRDVGELAAALAPFGGETSASSAARTRRILDASGRPGIAGSRSDSDRADAPQATPRYGGPPGEVSPPTVREGKQSNPEAPLPKPESRPPSVPAARTATSFAETRSPARSPRTRRAALFAGGAIGVVAAVGLVFWTRAPSATPSTNDLSRAATELVHSPVPVSTAIAATAAHEDPVASAPSSPSASASAAPTWHAPAPPISAAPRSNRPKPPANAGASDDVLLHRK